MAEGMPKRKWGGRVRFDPIEVEGWMEVRYGAHRRGKRWVASGYDRAMKRKRYLGTFDTRREADQAEAEWRVRARPAGRETCDQFAERWTRDYPRPRASTNQHNNERVYASSSGTSKA